MPAHAHGPLFEKGLPGPPDPSRVWEVVAQQGQTGEEITIAYSGLKVVGSGSFGVVCSAVLTKGIKGKEGEVVAIKKVLVDPRYKNRELQIMRAMSHPNIVELRAFFYSTGDKKDDVNLNLVLEYLPCTLHRALSRYKTLKQTMPGFEVKMYAYQLFRGLGYLHTVGLCHRDIKPPNILVDPATGILKIIDFGSAKQLVPTEPNVAYICSRYYRAPELIFGATTYTTQIDIWSSACVLAEVYLGQPMFAGDSSLDQLVDIIKILGTPSKDQINAMNPKYQDHKFPSIRPHPFVKFFRPRTDPLALDLLEKTLVYAPKKRLDAFGVMAHPFFDELRVEGAKMTNDDPLPGLFNFTRAELSARPDLIPKLVPEWTKPILAERGINLATFVPIPLQQLRLVFN
ncbi:Pkinase-domain-containing protein [Mrakia frigida]|uniref:GSK family serine/threonine-protein kinase n=1 Tax=Mrakia frigida TaxID=29902 RepID=UPI003FCBF523